MFPRYLGEAAPAAILSMTVDALREDYYVEVRDVNDDSYILIYRGDDGSWRNARQVALEFWKNDPTRTIPPAKFSYNNGTGTGQGRISMTNGGEMLRIVPKPGARPTFQSWDANP